MRILIAAAGYFPAQTYGGPPVSIQNFCNLLHNDIDMYIVTSDHEHGSTKRLEGIKEGWQSVGNARVMYLSEKQKSIQNFERIVNEVKPDWIYLNSLFDASNVLPFLNISKKKEINILLAPRGELCKGAFKKKYKKIPYILYIYLRGWLSYVSFQSTSQEESEAIRKYLWAKEKNIHYFSNIPSIPQDNLERNVKESGKARFVFISRIHPKKNLKSAISYFKDTRGDIKFDIYGPIEDTGYWIECQKMINELPSNISVNYCGVLTHEQVHSTFGKYDAFLFPTLSENYGHVIAEALFVGTPVIISDQTPWSDINSVNAGAAINLKSNNLFSSIIQKIVDMDNQEFSEMSIAARNFIEKKTNLIALKNAYLSFLTISQRNARLRNCGRKA